MRLSGAILTCSCALAVGCGGDEEVRTVTVPAPSEAEKTPATQSGPRAKEAAKRIAEAATLRLEDLPSGWQQKDDDGSDAYQGETCPSIGAAKRAVLAREESPDFSDDADQEIASTTYVYASEPEAERWFEELTSDATRACLRRTMPEAVTRALEKQDSEGDVGDATSSRVSIDEVVRDLVEL